MTRVVPRLAIAAGVLAGALASPPVTAGLWGVAAGALWFGDPAHATAGVIFAVLAAAHSIGGLMLAAWLRSRAVARDGLTAATITVYVTEGHDCPEAGYKYVRHVNAKIRHRDDRLPRAALATSLTHLADQVESGRSTDVAIEAPWS